MNTIVGEIVLFPFDDIPVGYLPCEGQSLDIHDYPRLYMMIGTKYGTDGKQDFKLPSLDGEAPNGLVYCITVDGDIPEFL